MTSGGTRILVIAGRIIRQLSRDRRTIGLIVVVPSLMLALLGYLISDDKGPVDLGVVNEDRAVTLPTGEVALGERLVGELKESELLSLRELRAGEWRDLLQRGEVKGVLLIPADFTRKLVSGHGQELALHLEGSEPVTAGQVQRGVALSLQDLMAERAGGEMPVTLATSYLYGGEDYGTLDYFAPGFIAGFVFFFVFLLTSVSFLRERSGGTIERLAASPVSQLEIVLGYLLGFSLFGALEALVILLFSIYVLKIQFVGSIALVLLVVLMLTLGAVNLGIFLSFFARNELQIAQFIPMVVIPQLLLGGLVWPVETLARPLQWLAAVMPLTYAISALKDVMIRGHDLAQIVPSLAFLLAFAVLMVGMAVLNLRREI